MKSLENRIDGLEKSVPPVLPCTGCGAPHREMSPMVVTNHDGPLERCKVCDRGLDEHGVPLTPRYKRIFLLPENR